MPGSLWVDHLVARGEPWYQLVEYSSTPLFSFTSEHSAQSRFVRGQSLRPAQGGVASQIR